MADEIHTIPEMLRFRAETEPDNRAFNFVDVNGPVVSITAADIYTLGGKFATRLLQYGFEKGDVIANAIPNSAERVITDMGIITAGCVVVNCQIIQKDGSNFLNVARISHCRGVILPNRESNGAYTLLSSSMPNNMTSSSECLSLSLSEAPTLKKAVVVNRTEGDPEKSLLDSLRSGNEEILSPSPSRSDLAVLFATSGSTGFSKLVPFKHESVFYAARMFAAIKGITSFTDRPMGWIGGFPFDFLAHGSERFVQDQFDDLHAKNNADTWKVIARTGCHGAALLPGAIYELIDIFKDDPPEFKLHFVATGGQALRSDLMKALDLLTGAIVLSYGATEGGMSFFKVITNASQFKDFQCGTVMKDVEYKILDEDGNELGTDKNGHLVLKSPRILTNYYNVETPSKRGDLFTDDGFYKTGDRVMIDSDGNLYCYGRMGDVVSMGGVLIYLSWPESILRKCPLLQDCSVLGAEEENGNAFLVACVVPSLGVSVTESQVLEYFEENIVNGDGHNSPMPKLSHVCLMDSLPILPSGKTAKKCLKKTIFQKLGLQSTE